MNPLLDGGSDYGQNVVFPLPYRILLLLGLGILGWASNLHVLDALDIDAVQALDLRTEDNAPVRLPVTQRDHANSSRAHTLIRTTYKVFLAYSVFCLGSWIIYRFKTKGDPLLVDSYGHIPVITSCLLILAVLCPFDLFYKTERDKFIQAIRRCLFSSSKTPILFADVIFADIGTSYAKVFGDIWLSLCMILPGNSLLNTPSHDGLARWILPAIMSFPYFVRFRQCLIEYNLPANESRRPFFNAIKYATSFPVIFLSAAQRIVVSDIINQKGEQAAAEPWHGEHRLFRLWLLAVFVNSAYSFWWDITNDWGFDLLKPDSSATSAQRIPLKRLLLPQLHYGTPLITRRSTDVSPTGSEFNSNQSPSSAFPLNHHKSHSSLKGIGDVVSHHHKTASSSTLASSHSHVQRQDYPWGLRPILLYPLTIYPLLIFLNLILRMSWSAKLSPHLHSAGDGSFVAFWLEVAEILRRWLWVFIRVEWEVVKRIQNAPVVERVVKVEFDEGSGEAETLSFEVLDTEAAARTVLPDA